MKKAKPAKKAKPKAKKPKPIKFINIDIVNVNPPDVIHQPPPVKRKPGHPTDYRPEYCEEIIEFMSSGKSLVQFAASIDVHTDTLHEWAKVHPAFSVSKKRAIQKAESFYDSIFQKHMVVDKADTLYLNNTNAIFYMKARFGWRDQPPRDEPKPQEENQAVVQDIHELAKDE